MGETRHDRMIMALALSLIKTFPEKAGAFATSILAAAFSFATVQLTTGNLLLALACTIASAGIANWPRIIKARSDASVNERTLTSTETSLIIQRLHDEVDFLSKANAVMRISKHAVLNECQRLGFHIEVLQQVIRDQNIEPPEFRKKTFQELSGEEDRKMSELTEVKTNGHTQTQPQNK